MNTSLDASREHFKDILDKGTELVLNQFSDLEQKKVYHDHPQEEVASWFNESLPEEGMGMDELFQEVKTKVLDKATNNTGPYMYAYIMTGTTQVSVVAEQLAAAVNQNVAKWHLAPSMSEIEKRVVHWASEMIEFGQDIGGVFVSGGSGANLAGLTIGRNIFLARSEVRKKGLFGMQPMIVYASKEVHNCVSKSMEVLGLGSNQLRLIDIKEDFTMDLEALQQQIERDILEGYLPFCIVGNAGTVNTGAIDDLAALADIAAKYQMWYHIDGAYGGLAATLDTLKDEFKGLDRADSLALDFHKWLYQPYEGGCVLVKGWNVLKQAYYTQASYLNSLQEESTRLNFNEHFFQLSRNAKSFKVWMSIKAYGMRRLRKMIQKDIDLANYLADQVEQSTDFELMARSSLAIACFRYVNGLIEEEIVDFHLKLVSALEKDGRVFIMGTYLKGQFALRACLINHRMHKETIDYLLQVIREVAEEVKKEIVKDRSLKL